MATLTTEGCSPVDFVPTKPRVMLGNFHGRKISTSHIERQNFTMRMSMRQLTGLTNGFSKKRENLEVNSISAFCLLQFLLDT